MRLFVWLLFISMISPGLRAQTSKGPETVESEIKDAFNDIKEQRKTRAKGRAKKREKLKYATSVAETVSPTDRDKLKRQIPALEKKVAASPEDPKLREQLGRAYLVNGDYERAVTNLKEASQEANTETLFLLAEAYRGRKDYASEIRTLEVITQTNENDSRALELLGYAYFNSEDLNKSSQYFRKALAVDPKRRKSYDGLLKIFEVRKNRYESRVVYADMVKAFGEDSQAYSGLCRLYTEDNLSESSIESCRKAISIDPNIPDNHVYLGMSYKYLKDMPQAQKILNKAAKTFPDSELALWASAQLADEMKNWESARFYYRKCVKADPRSARCYKRLAMITFNLKEYQDSLDAFARACELDRTTYTEIRNVTSQLRIANVEEWKEKFQEASDKCGMK
ncbi:MAG TPA: tetratricopeptide repeat protein [Bdellovibrionales bacterium]|nr:tetratricopeptide repeat protein [Bdellovibrionales bacterium]